MTEPQRACQPNPDCDNCGGYGGSWLRKLDGDWIGWALHPDEMDDAVGYAVCQCMIEGIIPCD